MWISLQFFPAQSPLSLSRSASQAHSLLSPDASLDSNGQSPISLYVQLGPFDIHFPLKPITNVLVDNNHPEKKNAGLWCLSWLATPSFEPSFVPCILDN